MFLDSRGLLPLTQPGHKPPPIDETQYTANPGMVLDAPATLTRWKTYVPKILLKNPCAPDIWRLKMIFGREGLLQFQQAGVFDRPAIV